MNKEISEMFWVGIDIIGGVILVMCLLGTMTQARGLFSTLESREMAEEALAENKEWRGFEGDWVTSADICNLVAKHGAEKTITITVNSYNGANWYAESAKDKVLGSYRGVTPVILNTVRPNDTNVGAAKVVDATAPTLSGLREYKDHFVAGENPALNEILNEKVSYAVKIRRDTTGVVRYIRIYACPSDTANYSMVWNVM